MAIIDAEHGLKHNHITPKAPRRAARPLQKKNPPPVSPQAKMHYLPKHVWLPKDVVSLQSFGANTQDGYSSELQTTIKYFFPSVGDPDGGHLFINKGGSIYTIGIKLLKPRALKPARRSIKSSAIQNSLAL